MNRCEETLKSFGFVLNPANLLWVWRNSIFPISDVWVLRDSQGILDYLLYISREHTRRSSYDFDALIQGYYDE